MQCKMRCAFAVLQRQGAVENIWSPTQRSKSKNICPGARRLPLRREGVYFCISSLLQRHFAFPFALPVAEDAGEAQ
jgi:hypothetical protein